MDKFNATIEDRRKAQNWLNKNNIGNKLYGIVHPTVISLGEEFYKERKLAERNKPESDGDK